MSIRVSRSVATITVILEKDVDFTLLGPLSRRRTVADHRDLAGVTKHRRSHQPHRSDTLTS